MRSLLLLLFALFSTALSFSQSIGGTDFWFTFPLNFANGQVGSPGQNQIVLVSGCEVKGEYSFPALGGAPVPFTVSPGSATTINLAANNNVSNEVVENNGIHIKTDNIVSAYAVDYLPYTVDGETMLPTNMLGTDYVVMGISESGSNLPSQFTVVATQNNTVVTITAKSATSANFVTQSHPAGATWTVTLNAGQTYMVSAAGASSSVSGTRVRSDKPVAVISHTPCTNYGGCAACDMIMCQSIPVNTWGTKYITAQAQARAGRGDKVEVISGPNNTSYTFNGANFTLAPYTKRVHATGANANVVIIANNPVQVSQYSHGTACDGSVNTDPEHIMIYPESMWISDYTFSCSTLLTTAAAGITIVVDGASGGTTGFEIDGNPIPSAGWTTIGTSTYQFYRMAVVPGPHHLSNVNGTRFSFYQYAVGDAESYIIQGGATYTDCQVAGCVATFRYSASPYCKTASNPSPTFVGAGVAGNFTATPAGLVFVSTSTGQIDLAASAPGTYNVTNSVAVNGGCSYTTIVTISAPRVADFSYNPPYCKDAANPSPTFQNGGVAGTFTAGAGLSINSNTGQVNLSASTAGTYTVTNTVPAGAGCPAATSTAQITITDRPVATFSYPNSPYCLSGSNPQPVFTGGGTAGAFTASPAGLVINASTGTINLAASQPGTYSITNTIAAAGGCPEVKSTATVTLSKALDPTFSYQNPFCPDDNNPLPVMGAGATKGTFSATGTVSVNSLTGQILLSGSQPGTYTITNTLAAQNGCPAVTHSAQLIINPIQNPAFRYSSSTFCITGSNPSAVISGTPGGTFSSTPAGLVFANTSTGEVNVSQSAIGSYDVTYTTPGPCARAATIKVTVTNAPVADFEYTNSPFCQDLTDPLPTFLGSGTAGIFSATPPGLVFVNTNTGEIDLALSKPNTYVVKNTIPASGGCSSAESTAPLTIYPVQDASFIYSSSTFCLGSTNPLPSVNGTPGGTFSSTPAGLVLNSTTGEIDLTSSALNSYTITYTTPGPCARSETFAVNLINVPQAGFAFGMSAYCQDPTGPQPIPVINGGALSGVFSSTGGLIISAQTGAVDLMGSLPGTYYVYNTLPAGGGCPEVKDSALLIINPLPVADFDYNTPFCSTAGLSLPQLDPGATAGQFTATGGVSINSQTGEFDPGLSGAGTFIITNTIAAAGGCPAVSATRTIVVTDPAKANFSYAGPYCKDANNPVPDLVPGAEAGVFSANPALVFISTTTGIVDLGASNAGTYTVYNTIAARGGCPDITDSTVLQINPIQSAAFTYPVTICKSSANVAATINGTTGGSFVANPSTLVFANVATGEIDVAATPAGAYVLTYTTPGPCARSGDFIVTITESPTADIIFSASPFCQTDGNPFPDFASGSVPGNFSALPAGLSFDVTTGQVNLAASSPGTYVLTNTVAAAGGCPPVSDTAVITVTAPPLAGFSYPQSPYCQNEISAIPVLVTGGSMGYFTALPAGLAIDTATGTVDLTNSPAGSFTVTNLIPASGGCPAVSATAALIIAPYSGADFDLPSVICPGFAGLPAISPGAVSGVFSSIPAGLVINDSSGFINFDQSVPGTYEISNRVTGAPGCPDALGLDTVVVPFPLTQVASGDMKLCYGVPFTLTSQASGGAGAYLHEWRNSSQALLGSSPVYTATGDRSESYTITTTDECGSAVRNTIEVEVSTPVVTAFEAIDTSGCTPLPVSFTNLSQGTFTEAEWFVDSVKMGSGLLTFDNVFSKPGKYTVSLRLTNREIGCSYYLEKPGYIEVFPFARAEFSYSPLEVNVIDPSIQIENNTQYADSFQWVVDDTVVSSGAEPQIRFTPERPYTYELCLRASNRFGCNDTICVPVKVHEILTLYIPNTFTPNGDGVNDVFLPAMTDGEEKEYLFQVFNRWGDLLFSTTDPTSGWDGSSGGEKMKNDIYIWKIRVKTVNHPQKTTRTGRVMLTR